MIRGEGECTHENALGGGIQTIHVACHIFGEIDGWVYRLFESDLLWLVDRATDAAGHTNKQQHHGSAPTLSSVILIPPNKNGKVGKRFVCFLSNIDL